jgi:hypothetical protein
MISISVAVCGDDWVNRDIVVNQLLTSNCQEPIVLNLNAEGPSLHALGIVDVVQDFLHKSGQSENQVYVENWSNSVEEIPFQRLNRHLLSHFFWLSDNYQQSIPLTRTSEYLFGYFVGRRSVPRHVMLQQIQQHYSKNFLLSLMNTRDYLRWNTLDNIQDWVSDWEPFDQWRKSVDIPCLDGMSVQDQYSENKNTNASLLKWYPKFDIELVAETYTHGNTFFPTEKTVRPIMAKKSLLIYGPQNYLKRLQHLGFRTWNDIWDESYDHETGPKRWNSIKKIIDHLITCDQEQLYQQCLPIVEHNRQHADTLIKKHRPG